MTVSRLTARAALIAAAFAVFAAPAHAGRLVTIDRAGAWTLERLGYGAVSFREDEAHASQEQTRRYALPRQVFQGPGHWYSIRLHFRVVFRRDAIPGTFSVTAFTNGHACALVIFDVTRRHGKLRVTADSLGEIDGRVVQTNASRTHELVFRNFLANRGVKPGVNTITFGLSQNVFPLFERLVIFPDTAIEHSVKGPAKIRLSVTLDPPRIDVGDDVRVSYRVVNNGRTPRSARIEASVGDSALELRDGPRVRMRVWRRADEPLTGAFVVRPRHAGSFPLELRATAGLTSATARTIVHVREDDSAPLAAAGAVVGALLAAAGGVLLLRRRRPS